MIKRINKACKYFPCHELLEDCAFCYCPFYPCLDRNKGRNIYSAKTKKNIWSCQACNWIHKKMVVDRIFSFIRTGGLTENVVSGNKNAGVKTGVIIFSHGSRLRQANEAMRGLIKAVKKSLGIVNVEPAYLRFYSPDFSRSVQRLIDNGCRELIVVPFFLLNGNHVTMDIPKEIKKQAGKYKNIRFIYTKNIGSDGKVIQIIVDRVKEAMEPKNVKRGKF